MTHKPKRYKIFLIIVAISSFLLLLDFSPMLYHRLFGDGGAFVMDYPFNISGDSLLKTLKLELCEQNTNTEKPYVSSIQPDKNNSGFTYVQLHILKSNEYIHLWIRTNEKNSTDLIFYGISNTPDFQNSRRINKDYDFIGRELIIKKIKRLVIDKLNPATKSQ